MSSPDTTPYVNLTVFDKDLQAIFDAAMTYAKNNLPDWNAKETNTEVVILEALALMVSESVFAINRLPDTMLEILLKLFGLTRSTGTFPTFTATLTIQSGATLPVTIPAGFEVIYDLGDGLDFAVFSLDSDVTISSGTTGTGTFTGNLRTARYNNVPANTAFTIINPLYFLTSVVTTTAISGGTGAETDTEYFQRTTARLARLSETLVVPRHFSNYAIEKSYVATANTVDLYNTSSGTGVPGSDYGHVAVFVFGDNARVSTSDQTTLQSELADRSLASVTPSVNGPDRLAVVGVHGTVVRTLAATSAAVETSIESVLDAYYSPSAWPWSKNLRWTNLVSLIENVAGVDFIKDTGASVDLEFTLNSIGWDRYHVASSTYATGTTTTWQATTNCTLAFQEAGTGNVYAYTDVGGSLAVTASSAGTATARLTDAVSTSTANALSDEIAEDEDYFLSARVKVVDGQTDNVRLGVEWFDSSQNIIGSAVETPSVAVIDGTWQLVSDRVTAPTGTVKAIIYLEVDSTAASSTFYFDAFTLSKFEPKNNDIDLSAEAPLVDLGEVEITIEAPA